MKYDQLKSDRGNFNNLWDEVSEMFLPRKSSVFDSKSVQGERKTKVFSSVGIHANEIHANAMHSMLTNPTIQFFEYTTGIPSLDTNVNVKKYLEARTEVTHNGLNDSNFHTEVHENYLDLGVFGTDILRMEEDDRDMIRFESRPVYEFVLQENEHGEVDQVGREKEFTGDQLLSKYGQEWIDKHFKGNFDQVEQYKRQLIADPVRKFTTIEFVQPKKLYERHKVEVTSNKAQIMGLVLKEHGMLIKESGFNEEIYAVSRLMKSSNEVYGRSYAMKSLPAMLSLNELMKIVIQSSQLNSKPTVTVPDDGGYPGFRIFPGAINYFRPGSERPEAFNPNSRHDISVEMLERLATEIKVAFMNDKLELPSFDRATTLEIQAKRDEDLRSMSPVLARQHKEKLIPLIRRVDAVFERAGAFQSLEVPKELEGQGITIKYNSAIARVQKSVLAENANKWLASMQMGMQMEETVKDNINFDNYAKYQAFALSAPAALLNSPEVIKQIRDQRAEQMQAQMEAEQAALQAETADKASGALQKLA
jgi:hypothetical protein